MLDPKIKIKWLVKEGEIVKKIKGFVRFTEEQDRFSLEKG